LSHEKTGTGRAGSRATGAGIEPRKGMMEMASYSEPIDRVSRRNNVLQRKLKAAFDRFIAADDQTKAARKAREEDPEYHEAIITIISDILRTRL
jgi:hypothetical protein